jgi:MutS domain V
MRQHIQIGNLRLVVALGFAILAWMSLRRGLVSPMWCFAPVLLFAGLARRHELVIRQKTRAERAVVFYDKGLARIEHRWVGLGETGDRFRTSAHPYCDDLDLFGNGGLFQLLSTARTRMGEEALADWLLASAPLRTVRARQAAVTELRDRLDLREDLAVLGEAVGASVHPERLRKWAEQSPVLDSRTLRVASAVLPCLLVFSIVGPSSGELAWLRLAVLIAEVILGLCLRSRVKRVVGGVEHAAQDLGLLAEVLSRLEREKFQSPRLKEVQKLLDTEGVPPSQKIARLKRLVEMLDSRENIFMRVIGPPLLYTTQFALAVEAWRKATGSQVGLWLDAVGELEALCSLAGYSYEHPAYSMPELCEEGPTFVCAGMGHPLLPAARCVRNDVSLGAEQRVWIVSGSNMSGKSTLLRAVGVNAILAMAGAPVCADRLWISGVVVGASIRPQDSLQGGTSRFYAEITRLRRLTDLTNTPAPLLFLLDELLHGTNSHDRRIGAEGIVKALVGRGAFGLLTTHDLALTHIAEQLVPPGLNVHFQDHIENGKITFDYQLRPGIVEKSNALELMRSIGLEV